MDERCYNCRFFGTEFVVGPETDHVTKDCLRHAPVLSPDDGPSSSGRYPQVAGSHWCGDWQMNATWPEKRMQYLQERNMPPFSADNNGT